MRYRGGRAGLFVLATLLAACSSKGGGEHRDASASQADASASGDPDASTATRPDADTDCPAYAGGGTVCVGTYTISNTDDLDAVAGCARITGNLEIDAAGLTDVELPLLEQVDGDILYWLHSSVVRIALPELKVIGGWLHATARPDGSARRVLETVEVSRLRTVTSGIGLSGWYTRITTLALPCLMEAGALGFEQIDVDAPRLTRVGGNLFGGIRAPILTDVGGLFGYGPGVDVPALAHVGQLFLWQTTDHVSLPALASVTGTATFGCYDSTPGNPIPEITAPVIELPSLVSVGELRVCPPPALTSFAAPALRHITGPAGPFGNLVMTGAALPVITLPALETISGDLVCRGGTVARSLQSIAGSLWLTGARADMPALRTVSGDVDLSIAGSAATPFDLTGLESIGGYLELQGYEQPMRFPALASIGGHLLSDITNITELVAPALTSIGGYVYVAYNFKLATLDLASLVSVGAWLDIKCNPVLPAEQATAILDRLRAAGWTGTAGVYANGEGMTCP